MEIPLAHPKKHAKWSAVKGSHAVVYKDRNPHLPGIDVAINLTRNKDAAVGTEAVQMATLCGYPGIQAGEKKIGSAEKTCPCLSEQWPNGFRNHLRTISWGISARS